MIFTALIVGIMLIVQLIFVALPFNIPPMPSEISIAFNYIFTYLDQVIKFLRYIYTPTFFNVFIGAIIVYLTFEFLYNSFWWVIRKIPFIDIH